MSEMWWWWEVDGDGGARRCDCYVLPQLHRHLLVNMKERAESVQRVPSQLELFLIGVEVIKDEDEARDDGRPVEGDREFEDDDDDLLVRA